MLFLPLSPSFFAGFLTLNRPKTLNADFLGGFGASGGEGFGVLGGLGLGPGVGLKASGFGSSASETKDYSSWDLGFRVFTLNLASLNPKPYKGSWKQDRKDSDVSLQIML